MRISDWSSDVCSSDLVAIIVAPSSMLLQIFAACPAPSAPAWITALPICDRIGCALAKAASSPPTMKVSVPALAAAIPPDTGRSEEHTSELQSLMRISYAVFCLKKKTKHNTNRPQLTYKTTNK